MELTISQSHDGMLLRDLLCRELCISRRAITHLKQKENGILLDGQRVTVRAVLRQGQHLSLALDDEDTHTSVVPAGDMPPILYEDEDVLVCNKSGDMPTHPSHGHFDDTLANAVAAYDISCTGRARVFRPITRLDRETSGVVLIARNRRAAAKLSEDMQQKHIQKTYLAILEGVPTERQGEITHHIRRTADSIILREVCDADAPDAQAALTRYRVLCDWSVGKERRSLVMAEPHTGRTHQLRVHFASLGTPIAGDGLYGRPSDDAPSRTCLHAFSLSFVHPSTGERMTLRAPLPDDIVSHLPNDIKDQPDRLICLDE